MAAAAAYFSAVRFELTIFKQDPVETWIILRPQAWRDNEGRRMKWKKRRVANREEEEIEGPPSVTRKNERDSYIIPKVGHFR